jgi:hypothetical protein
LAARTRETFDAVHAFDLDPSDAAQALFEVAGLLDKATDESAYYQQLSALQRNGRDDLRVAIAYAHALQGDKRTKSAQLRQTAQELETGNMTPAFEKTQALHEMDLKGLWRLLEQTSRRLEAIARKQLAGTALDDDDGSFLLKYGETLAAIMLYGGNSYLDPRDDAPRVADVYWHYILGSLHAGIGRPRAMYVLYPWQGKDILCKGAVLPYYEFVNQERLTDFEWKRMLDSDNRPDVPKWLRPIICEKGLGPADFAGGRPSGRRGP